MPPKKNKEEKGLPPFVLDRFEVVRQIGQGAYGLVYQANDKKTGTKVALKRCVKVLTNIQDAHRTLREIAILTHLRKAKHPNIVEMTHAMAVPNTKADLYLAFEFFEGDMRSGIRSAHFRSREAILKVAVQVICGMAFIEACGLIHLDMKPENLLVDTETLRVVIADFGLARAASASAENAAGLDEQSEGTLPYMAPELLLEIGKASYASDIWAYGVILGEMFCGRAFIKGREKLDNVRKILAVLGEPEDLYLDKLDSEFLPVRLELERLVEDVEDLEPEPGTELAWRSTFKQADPLDIQLLQQILVMEPSERLTAQQILEHPALEAFLPFAAEGMQVNSSCASPLEIPLDGATNEELDIVDLRRTIHQTIDRSYDDGGCRCNIS